MNSRDVHSIIGGSVAKQFRKCPGSVNLRRRLGPSPSSPAAREGTRLHNLQELCLRSQCMADDFVGLRLEDDAPDAPLLTAAQCEAVNVVLRQVYEWLKEPDAVLFVEAAFDLADIRSDAFGRCDVLVWTPSLLRVLDAKFGEGTAVEVENEPGDEVRGNDQCLYYAAGARRYLAAIGYAVPDEIEITIAQPRRAHTDGPVRSLRVNIFELYEYEATLAAAVAATEAPDAPCIPGPHCKFCPGTVIDGATGRYKCDAYQADHDAATDAAFATLADPVGLATLDAAEIARRYSQLSLLKKYIRDFESFAKLRARQTGLPGYDWAPGGRDWAWTAPDADIIAITRAMLGDEKTDALSKFATPVQAEKTLDPIEFAELAQFVRKSTAAPKLVKAGSRKTTLTLAEVQAHYQQHSDDVFADIEADV